MNHLISTMQREIIRSHFQSLILQETYKMTQEPIHTHYTSIGLLEFTTIKLTTLLQSATAGMDTAQSRFQGLPKVSALRRAELAVILPNFGMLKWTWHGHQMTISWSMEKASFVTSH